MSYGTILLILLLAFLLVTLLAAIFMPHFYDWVEHEDEDDPFDPDMV